MSDEYYYLQKKQWRSISYNWNTLSNYGNTSRAYCLTDFQAAWLLSNTDYMSWSTRWENCPCTDEDLIDMKAELDYRLMDCIDIQPYQLQYIYQQENQRQLDGFQASWDADPTPSNINPSTPDDYYSGDDSQERLDALCTACKIYVYSYAQNWVNQAQVILGIVAVVGLVSSITLVGGIIAGTVFAGLALVTALALTAMQDTSALDAVACCMYDGLNGLAINNANFLTCLDGCSFTPGTNEAIARDIIASDLDVFSNWLSFLDSLGDSYNYANIGITDCPCAPAEWEHVFDFTVDNGGWTARNIWGTGVCALYQAPYGWQTQDRSNGASEWSRLIAIERTVSPDTLITNIEMVYTCDGITYSSGLASETGLSLVLRNSGVAVSSYVQPLSAVASGVDVLRGNPDDGTADNLRLFLRCSDFTSAIFQNSAVISSCTVRGMGSDPF